MRTVSSGPGPASSPQQVLKYALDHRVKWKVEGGMATSQGYYLMCSLALIFPFHHKRFPIRNVYGTACTAVQNISLAG